MAESNIRLCKDQLIVAAALQAGKIGMKYFREKETDVWYKAGNSPVSRADYEIDTFLKEQLLAAQPGYGWLSEETEDNHERLDSGRIFVVDPIDGTRGFISGRKEWCISIAIIEAGRPVEGVLHCPALERTIYAKTGAGAFFDSGSKKQPPWRNRPLVTGSKKLIETIRNIPGEPMQTSDFIPSLAYRLSLVATGELDAAFARPGASEWDIAAADVILQETDCVLSDRNGKQIEYNCQDVRSPALVAASVKQQKEILGLANSSGILQ